MPGQLILRIAALAVALGALLPALAPPPALARGIPCPDRHAVTVRDLLALAPGSVSGYWGENPRARACFGRATITIRGYANWPEGLGGASLSGIKPAYFESPNFFLFASSRELAPGFGRGDFYGIVVPPRLGAVEKRYHRVWVVVTAHFVDPLATRCRGYGPKGDRPSRAAAIASCRNRLVMVSVARASGPPATAIERALARGDHGSDGTPQGGLPPVAGLAVGLAACLGWRRMRGRPAQRTG